MPRTVLVVDDSTSFRTTARVLLEARGFDVVGTAADGAGALEAVGRLRPDAVLLDVNLPDLDGITVARRLADGAADATPTVVLVSTHDASAYGEALGACGARGFVPKAELASPRLVELLGAPGATDGAEREQRP